ncbi:late competence development ComFB family protein [Planktothrix pseudagardhii]|uniref:Late competence development ComFB family protein n=1 Tax=Planktothrix pseudagardhii TaxID=132604 RepID=A0A9W4G4X4_9CYAN|nr:late competence development ComFB family protein [Planktothrix pseudagardhii]CAD5937538.1 hypothetical protein NO713_01699 [Planktothrix pseudagardhii]
MENKLLNLTLPFVIEEIENILETYPKSLHQETFSANNLRQELVAYVLSRVPNKYIVVDKTENLEQTKLSIAYSSQRLLDIEYYIHLGIRDIFGIFSSNNMDIQPNNNQNFRNSRKVS